VADEEPDGVVLLAHDDARPAPALLFLEPVIEIACQRVELLVRGPFERRPLEAVHLIGLERADLGQVVFGVLALQDVAVEEPDLDRDVGRGMVGPRCKPQLLLLGFGQQCVHALGRRHFIDEVERVDQFLGSLAVGCHEDLGQLFIVQLSIRGGLRQRQAPRHKEAPVRIEEGQEPRRRNSP
jgi:hypothetical protein